MTIIIEEVTDKAGLKRFIDVPKHIFADDPIWIAPLDIERRDHLSVSKNPFFDHGEAALFIARKNGRDVGRISAQINQLHHQYHDPTTGHFGFLDAIDDIEVFKALIRAAETWLKSRNMQNMTGPYSFSINEESGLLVDGFDTPPSIMMGHAKPWYHRHLETLGLNKAKDLIAYAYDPATPLPRAMQHMVNKATKAGDIELRTIEKRHLARELDLIIDIFNDAWSDNWGFVPMTKREINALGQVMRFLLKEGYVAIASHQGEAVAMAVTLPDINDWVKDFGGSLGPLKIMKLLWRIYAHHPSRVRLPLMGVKKKFHATPIGAAMTLAVIDQVRQYHYSNGVTFSELSWILDDNMPMRRIIEQLGGVSYKTYRVYAHEW